MARFVHDRVIFLGDSAHLVSPFGARGWNGGVADADNLCWKLDAVLRGKAGSDLIETYNDEAVITADENILNSSRSTDFMTPKTPVAQAFRDVVLDLAEAYLFARPFVNSGRLSTAVFYPESKLTTPDIDDLNGKGVLPGRPAIDAPNGNGWLLDQLAGDWALVSAQPLEDMPLPTVTLDTALARERYGLANGGAYLIRPDQYVAARWLHFKPEYLETTAWAN